MHSLILHHFDRAVRRPRAVEERLGLQSLGLVPAISIPQRRATEGSRLLMAMERFALPQRSPHKQQESGPDLTRKVLDDPFSHFSEGLRSTKTALDIMALTRPIKCLGVISAIPGEGKSTISVNLANLFAGSGKSTLLIDGDMRNPQLSRHLAADADHGLLELIAGAQSLAQTTRSVRQSPLRFVPTVLRQRIANTGDLLASERMRGVLAEARREYEQVIVDLPPLGPVSDARAIAPQIDAFIMVIHWGHTRFDVLEEALNTFGEAADKIVGVVLNKVDYQQLRNMEPYSYNYYYNKSYAKYGYAYSQD